MDAKSKRDMIKSLIFIAAGIIIYILYFLLLLDSFWLGLGGAVILFSLIRIFQIMKAVKSEVTDKKIGTYSDKEQVKFFSKTAMAYTFYISTALEAVAVIVSKYLGMDGISMLLAYVACLQLIIYVIIYLVVKKVRK